MVKAKPLLRRACLLALIALLPFVSAFAEDAEGGIRPDTPVYYNAEGGRYYHLDSECDSVHPSYREAFASAPYSELFSLLASLAPCDTCVSLETQTLWFGEKQFREAWPALKSHLDALGEDPLQPYAWRVTPDQTEIVILAWDAQNQSREYSLTRQGDQWEVKPV